MPALLMACVHLCVDDSERRAILDGPLRPQGLFLNEYQGYMSPEDQAAARALALDVIRRWRERGCPDPEPLPPSLLHEMMTWLACDTVGEEYVPMMLEELALDGRDSRRPDRLAGADAYPVVIIGCGMSGPARRDPAAAGGLPVRRGREERRAGRDLVGEPLPRRPGRRRQPLLLLQLRARRPLDRVLLPAAGAPGVLPAGARGAGHRGARQVRHRGHRRDVRRRDPHLDGPPGGRRVADRPGRRVRGRPAQPALRPGRPRRVRRARVPHGAMAGGRRPHRQGRGDGRCRCDRVPGGAGDRGARCGR